MQGQGKVTGISSEEVQLIKTKLSAGMVWKVAGIREFGAQGTILIALHVSQQHEL